MIGRELVDFDWISAIATTNAFAVTLTPVASGIIPIGLTWYPDPKTPEDRKISAGCAGMEVKVDLTWTDTGNSDADVDFQIFRADEQKDGTTFIASNPIWEVRLPLNGVAQINSLELIPVELSGSFAVIKCARSNADTDDIDVDVWYRRFRYTG